MADGDGIPAMAGFIIPAQAARARREGKLKVCSCTDNLIVLMPSTMRSIALTKGKIALVDDEDYDHLSKHKWFAKTNQSGIWYVGRNSSRLLGKRKTIFMHSELMSNLGVDHINGDGLDNRRSNLRLATTAQNGANRKLSANNTSGVTGVYWHRAQKKWGAQIKVNRRMIYLGRFIEKQDAISERQKAAKIHFGEFARL